MDREQKILDSEQERMYYVYQAGCNILKLYMYIVQPGWATINRVGQLVKMLISDQ
jgi:hypothetical protein